MSAMVQAGQHILAQEFCDSWGLDPEQHGITQVWLVSSVCLTNRLMLSPQISPE